MSDTTTTTGRFPVQDVTFHGARSQSEVAREILAEKGITNPDRPTQVPKSLTPEQLIKFFSECAAKEPDRLPLYLHMVKVIKEYSELKKENKTLKARVARLEDENARLKYTDGDINVSDEVENDVG